MFSVTPKKGITMKAPINDTGIPIKTQKAIEGLRNNVSNASTKIPPCNALVVKVEIRFLTICESSSQKLNSTPVGKLLC